MKSDIIQVRMYALFGLSCLVVLLHSSSSVPLADKKPTPVDLAYSCLKVHSAGKNTSDEAPVILIHGLGVSKESWMGIYQLIAMRTNRKVCVADLRNHGDSPWSDEANVAAMAEDISRLLDKLAVPKAILLGHSLGGKVCMHFALNHPDRVRKLIVEDMRPNGLTAEAAQGVKYFLMLLKTSIDRIPEGSDERTAKKIVAQYIGKELAKVNASELVDERGVEFLPIKCSNGKCQWKTNTKLIGQLLKDINFFMNESSGLFNGPTLFVYGMASPFKIKEDESSILKLFPQAKLVGVEGASHLVHKHREFSAEVIKFINAKD